MSLVSVLVVRLIDSFTTMNTPLVKTFGDCKVAADVHRVGWVDVDVGVNWWHWRVVVMSIPKTKSMLVTSTQ